MFKPPSHSKIRQAGVIVLFVTLLLIVPNLSWLFS